MTKWQRHDNGTGEIMGCTEEQVSDRVASYYDNPDEVIADAIKHGTPIRCPFATYQPIQESAGRCPICGSSRCQRPNCGER